MRILLIIIVSLILAGCFSGKPDDIHHVPAITSTDSINRSEKKSALDSIPQSKESAPNVKNDKRCNELFGSVAPSMMEIAKNYLKLPMSGITYDVDNNIYYENVCHEAITCDSVEYCILFIKPNGTIVSPFANEKNVP
jgi:hypothetical protein